MNPQNSFNLPSIDCKELPLLSCSASFRFVSPSIVQETQEQLTDALQSQKSKYICWFETDKDKIGPIYKKRWGGGNEWEGGLAKKNQDGGSKEVVEKLEGENIRKKDKAEIEKQGQVQVQEQEQEEKVNNHIEEIKIEFQNSDEEEGLVNSINSPPITPIPTPSFKSRPSTIQFFCLPPTFPTHLPSPLPLLPTPFPLPLFSVLPLSNALALLPPTINLRCLSLFFIFKFRISEASAFSILLRTDLSLNNSESMLIRLEREEKRTFLLLARRVGRTGEYQCLKKCEVPWKDEEQEDEGKEGTSGKEKDDGLRGRKKREHLERKGEGGKNEEATRGIMDEKEEMKEEFKNKNERDKEKEEVEFDIRKLKDGGEIELNMKARKQNGKKWKSPRHQCGNYKSSCDSNCSNSAPTSSYHSQSPNLPVLPCSNSNTSSSIFPSSLPLPLTLHPPNSTISHSSFIPPSFNIPSTCSLHPLSSFAPPTSEIVPVYSSPRRTWILEGLDSGEETLCISLHKEGSEEKFKRNYEGLAPFLGEFHIYMAGEGGVEIEGIDLELRKRKNKKDEEDDETISKCRCEII